jgi:hypothetical protein
MSPLLHYQLTIIWPILVLVASLVVLCVYVHYQTDKQYKLKFLLGPLLIVAAVMSVIVSTDNWGYAFPSHLPKKFEYISHRLVLSEDSTKKEWIDIYMQSVDPPEPRTRLRRIPYNKKMEEALKQAQQMMRQGGASGGIMMNGTGKEAKDKQGSTDGDEYPDYVPHRITPQEVMPKGVPVQPQPENPSELVPDTQRFKT